MMPECETYQLKFNVRTSCRWVHSSIKSDGTSVPDADKILKMCLGIWSRLKFAYLSRGRPRPVP